jgi:hypothetical protein
LQKRKSQSNFKGILNNFQTLSMHLTLPSNGANTTKTLYTSYLPSPVLDSLSLTTTTPAYYCNPTSQESDYFKFCPAPQYLSPAKGLAPMPLPIKRKFYLPHRMALLSYYAEHTRADDIFTDDSLGLSSGHVQSAKVLKCVLIFSDCVLKHQASRPRNMIKRTRAPRLKECS